MTSTSNASASKARLLGALIAFALALGALPAAAAAKKKVVIFDFSGPRASRFHAKVRAIVKKHYTVVSDSRYAKMARRLRAKRPTQRNVIKVSRKLSVAGLVTGKVKRRHGRYELVLRVRSGVTGEFVDSIKVRTRHATLSGATLRKVREQLLVALKRLPDADSGSRARSRRTKKSRDRVSRRSSRSRDTGDDDDDDSAGDSEDPFASGGSNDDSGSSDDRDSNDDRGSSDDRDDKRVADRDSGDDSPFASDSSSSGGEVSDKKKSSGETTAKLTDADKEALRISNPGIEISAGLSVVQRKLSFTVSSGLGNQAPRGYDGTPVAGAYVTGELYPMAFNDSNRGTTRDIGATFVLDRVIKIESRLRYQDAMGADQTAVLPTEQQRWGVGIVFRHNFGHEPTKPTVKLSVRYNKGKFVIDKTAAPMGVSVDIPNMEYTYLDPGLLFRYPLSPTLALQLDGRFLLVTDTGEMQQADQYGGASVTGYDFDAAAEYKMNPKLFFRLGFHMTGIAYDFKGTGMLTTNRDGDPTTQDVFGAMDRYLGGYLTAGYLF